MMNTSMLTPPAPASVRHDLIYQLTMTVLVIDPSIWRRLAVPTCIRLSRLHRCIQTAIGRQDYHLHEFRTGPRVYGVYGIPDVEFYDRRTLSKPSE